MAKKRFYEVIEFGLHPSPALLFDDNDYAREKH